MFDAGFHLGNRRALIDALGGNCIVVVAGNGEMQKTNDEAYPFVQNANFWYLSGIDAPDWWMIIDGRDGTAHLVAPKLTYVKAAFDGELSPDEAHRISGAQSVMTIAEAREYLRSVSSTKLPVYVADESAWQKKYYTFGRNPRPEQVYRAVKRVCSVQSCLKQLYGLRMIKQPIELETQRAAIACTMNALEGVKSKIGEFRYEYEVNAHLTNSFLVAGMQHGYEPIIASGPRSATVHYIANDQPIVDGALLLLDVGARCGRYSADISRTYAVGDAPTRQLDMVKELGEIQRECIAMCRPGVKLADVQKYADGAIADLLISHGVMQSHERSDIRRYFCFAIGHGLGIDTHDHFAGDSTLLEGMVITIEPGFIIPSEDFGVRIEDDILITADGSENLSENLSIAP